MRSTPRGHVVFRGTWHSDLVGQSIRHYRAMFWTVLANLLSWALVVVFCDFSHGKSGARSRCTAPDDSLSGREDYMTEEKSLVVTDANLSRQIEALRDLAAKSVDRCLTAK